MNARRIRLPAIATILLAAGAAGAQSVSPPPASIPPPPDFDQPVPMPTRPSPPAAIAPAPATSPLQQAVAPVIPAHNPMGQPPPTVSVHKVQGDVVEEYRAGGRLIMVRIIPAHGPTQTFYANTEGQLRPDPGQGPVAPVFFTLYQWGH